jgi:hypothetical protein
MRSGTARGSGHTAAPEQGRCAWALAARLSWNPNQPWMLRQAQAGSTWQLPAHRHAWAAGKRRDSSSERSRCRTSLPSSWPRPLRDPPQTDQFVLADTSDHLRPLAWTTGRGEGCKSGATARPRPNRSGSPWRMRRTVTATGQALQPEGQPALQAAPPRGPSGRRARARPRHRSSGASAS